MEKSELVQITRRSAISEDEFLPFVNAMFEQVWGNLWPPQILTDDLSNTVEKNVITPRGTTVPDCRKCGACCASFVCVDVAPGNPVSSKDCWDISREGENGRFIVDRFIKRKEEDFSCTALEGNIGEDVICRIYENRPRMCREFEAGSDRCHAVRRAFGLEPFLTLGEMSAALEKINALDKSVDAESIVEVHIIEEMESENLQISVTLKEGSAHIIHTFDPNLETWFQTEFDALKLSKAKLLVASRIKKG